MHRRDATPAPRNAMGPGATVGSSCGSGCLRAAIFLLVSRRLAKTTGQVVHVDGGLEAAFLR